MTELKKACEQLAEELFFRGAADLQETVKAHGLTMRRGKTIEDVKAAFAKGVRRGRGKFEREIEEVQWALAEVLKRGVP